MQPKRRWSVRAGVAHSTGGARDALAWHPAWLAALAPAVRPAPAAPSWVAARLAPALPGVSPAGAGASPAPRGVVPAQSRSSIPPSGRCTLRSAAPAPGAHNPGLAADVAVCTGVVMASTVVTGVTVRALAARVASSVAPVGSKPATDRAETSGGRQLASRRWERRASRQRRPTGQYRPPCRSC